MTKEEKKKLADKQYREANKEKIKAWREANKEKIKTYNKSWREDNKEYKTLLDKEYKENNKEKIKEQNKIYRQNNKEVINQKLNIKRQVDVLFNLKHNIRGLIRQSIKRQGYSKKTKTYEILGCSFETFKEYIESKFEPWMNWDNYGLYNGELNHGWDIDHIVPSVTANSEEEILRLNNYTNLQPLCSYTNRVIKRDNPLW